MNALRSDPTRRALGLVILLALCALAILRSWHGTRLDTFTVDEPWHIVAGASYLRHDDFRLNPEHPPLVKLVAGASVAHDFRLPDAFTPSEKAQERDAVERVMFVDNDPARAQARARIAMWSFHGGLLLILGLLLWRAFGLAWAAGALAFLALEPTVAAHLPVVMTDLSLALTLAIAALCAGLLATSWQWRWAIASGVAFGLALGTKHSALAALAALTLGLGLAALLARRTDGWPSLPRRITRLLFAAVLALGVLWAQYGLRFHAGADGSDRFNRPIAEKIADLKLSGWREGIAIADRWQLLPRAYLWGLADTIRAGVEGRGQSEHRIWGRIHQGEPPWFTWPSVIVSKLPLALIAVALIGALLLRRALPEPRRSAPLWFALGAAIAHLLALASSQGTYGGVRHALPLVVLLAIPAGAAIAFAWRRRGTLPRIALAALLVAAAAMTLGEPRVWEYHNELAGGTAGAHRQFGNEGLDLGQRLGEVAAFYHRVIVPSGEPLYVNTWFPDRQLSAAGLPEGRYVESLADTNVGGSYRGWFIYESSARLPHPSRGWDPAVALAGLVPVQRLGHIEIWRGTQTLPLVRAYSIYNRVVEHVHRDGGRDWALVASRLAEATPLLPGHVGAAIELGNARLQLGDRAGAARAYAAPLHQLQAPLEPLVRASLEEQVARLADEDAVIAPLRNPWLE